MKRSNLIAAIALALAMMVSASAGADETPVPQARTQNGITYMTGGVGADELEAMRAAAKGQYNLELVFAETASGAYLADANVTIQDAKGKTLLEVPSSGPEFFARLPPGRYVITVERGGVKQAKSITVTDKGLRRFILRWSA